MPTGPEKAVLFLLSLDEEVARPIVSELGESELRKLRTVAATMREVPTGTLREVFTEFLERSSAAVAVPRGGLPYLRRLSAASLGEDRARAVFEDGVTSPLARLEVAPPDAIATLLASEPPQIVAAILARLEPDASASILARMPVERQAAVVGHVSRLAELPAKVLEDMATALADQLPPHDAGTFVSVDGVSKAAQILNATGRTASTPILETLEQSDQALATQIREAMFTFDDLAKVDPRNMRTLLREISTERLTIALKNAREEVAAAIFAGLSQRAADLIRDDLSIMPTPRRTEIEQARTEIVQAAIRLESEGKLDLGREEST